MNLEDIRRVLEDPQFLTGLRIGLTVSAGGALLGVLWRPSLRHPVAPVAGMLLAVAVVVTLVDGGELPSGLVAALILLSLGGSATGALRESHPAVRISVELALLAGGGLLLAEATRLEGLAPKALLASAAVIGGALVASTDHAYRRLALGPVLLVISVGGAYVTVPETDVAIAVLGATTPIAALAWPFSFASLGRPGSFAAVGLIAWLAATAGASRPGSVVGAVASLGLFLAEPVGRALGRERRGATGGRWGPGWIAPAMIVAHLGLVLLTARVAGMRTDAGPAAVIAGLGLAGAVVVVALWLPSSAVTRTED